MRLFIKNMISSRSKSRVTRMMQSLGLHPILIEIGEVEIKERLSVKKYDALKEALRSEDFELIIDKATILVEKIRTLIIEMIHYHDEIPNINFSSYISKKLQINYTYLSKFFSKFTNITIEHFIIAQRIEKAKQLLLHNELTLSQIAWKLHYSSTAHLSTQFKKVTGLTPSEFKKSEFKHLIPVDTL